MSKALPAYIFGQKKTEKEIEKNVDCKSVKDKDNKH